MNRLRTTFWAVLAVLLSACAKNDAASQNEVTFRNTSGHVASLVTKRYDYGRFGDKFDGFPDSLVLKDGESFLWRAWTQGGAPLLPFNEKDTVKIYFDGEYVTEYRHVFYENTRNPQFREIYEPMASGWRYTFSAKDYADFKAGNFNYKTDYMLYNGSGVKVAVVPYPTESVFPDSLVLEAGDLYAWRREGALDTLRPFGVQAQRVRVYFDEEYLVTYQGTVPTNERDLRGNENYAATRTGEYTRESVYLFTVADYESVLPEEE